MNGFAKTKKKKIAITVLICMAAAAVILFSVECFSNIELIDTESSVESPEFSRDSGFYQKAFYLEISGSAGTTIYYTTDGSDPDDSSAKYEKPILLKNATNQKNVYSARTDTSTGFLTDLIDKYPKYYEVADQAPGYQVPDFKVDKCNIIKAVAIDDKGKSSDIITKSYYVGIDSSKYDGCNVLSIVTDPENLFGYTKGIYVTGKIFDQYKESDEIGINYNGTRWKYWSANYRQHGKAWERKASLTFFNEDGKLLESKNAGIRISGGCSRGIAQKSLSLFAREKYDETQNFSSDFFGDGYKADQLTVSGGGSQPILQFNDYMMSQRTSGLNFTTMKFSPYVLFLDGEYWGFYWLTTRYSAGYLSNYYGVDEDNILMIKEGDVAIGSVQYGEIYTNMVDTISNGDMSEDSGYQRACQLIDMDSFIDYYATQIYIARNGDWPGSNFALWRTIEVRDDKYSDGKWRWMMYDSNSGAMTKNIVSNNTLEDTIEDDKLFSALWENKTFRAKFQKRILEIADECFDPDEMDEFIENFRTGMKPSMAKSWARFYGSDNKINSQFNYAMYSRRVFFEKRKAVVESWFE